MVDKEKANPEEMLYQKEDYLEVDTYYNGNSIEIQLNEKDYRIEFPRNVWNPLEEPVKQSIVDHVAFLSTNYLPLVLGKKGVIYNTRLPMFDCFSFKSMMYDMPSNVVLDVGRKVDYVKGYFNLDFVFASQQPTVWSKPFEARDTAVISFTSGKESLLTLAMCMELGLEPILINVVEPSNTYENGHKIRILRELKKKFGVRYYSVPQDVGLFHDAEWMASRKTSMGWGNQLMYYMFIYLPFIFHHGARYLFYGNEASCDSEIFNPEGYRANFCYDQSSHWTIQQDVMMRLLTGGSTRVGSLVGPLNEIAVVKCLHSGFPELARYQMSCFCDDPAVREHKWCCNCSKCARNYAFIQAVEGDVEGVGFWRDMFSEECKGLFSAFDGKKTYGFDRSGLGREEQELALFLASERMPDNLFLQEFVKRSRYNNANRGEETPFNLFKRVYAYYFTPQEYPAIPGDLKDEVYAIYNKILNSGNRVGPRGEEAESLQDAPLEVEDEGAIEITLIEQELEAAVQAPEEE